MKGSIQDGPQALSLVSLFPASRSISWGLFCPALQIRGEASPSPWGLTPHKLGSALSRRQRTWDLENAVAGLRASPTATVGFYCREIWKESQRGSSSLFPPSVPGPYPSKQLPPTNAVSPPASSSEVSGCTVKGLGHLARFLPRTGGA